MLVTYLDHSGFCVELQKHILIFDYVKGNLPPLDADKQLYFFVSHGHADHLHSHIKELCQQYPKAKLLLSNDIKLTADISMQFVQANQIYTIDDLSVETFQSTDQGVAFLIAVEQQTIYHAGDLHWWHWRGEPEVDLSMMKKAYFDELKKLQGRNIHLAFLVLDPRLEEDYWMGFDAFIRNSEVHYVIPMHCWGNYELMKAMLIHTCSEPYRNRVITYDHAGQQMLLGGK